MKALALLLLLVGCAAQPIPIEGGSVTCVHVSTLATTTTTVYVAADRPGTVVVLPDCTVSAVSQ
jgi:starvation-inducible outer membrane lipoprotein